VKLYTIYENGVLKKIDKVDFNEKKVYLIDDFKVCYLWFGSLSSEKKKKFGEKRAKDLNNTRKSPVKIQIIHQNKEYGTFLVIMDILRKGLKSEGFREKRDELVFEIEETLELIDTGLELDLEAEITLKAHKLSQEGISYEELSKRLAKSQLILLKGKGKPLITEIKKKTEEILNSSSTFEELCWLVSELELLIEKKQME
jgi:predicted DNA-binding antitoxin AbrB/MazE fold protein